jgi:hypothetical protein
MCCSKNSDMLEGGECGSTASGCAAQTNNPIGVDGSAQPLGSSMSSESFDVVEISSGLHEETLWVSLGFSSKLEELDVLHFVCAIEVDEQDRRLGHDAIYLERFDQAYSCYAGAEEIVIGTAGVHLKLNPHGRQSLSLPHIVDFLVGSDLKGWSGATKIFKRMQDLECGRVLRVA